MESERKHVVEQQPDSKVVTAAKKNIASVFEDIEPNKWRENLLRRLEKYDWLSDMDMVQAGKTLEGIDVVDDIETFTDTVLTAYAPVIARIEADPALFLRELQEQTLPPENKMLNELLHYHVDEDDNMHLHVFPNTDRPDQLRLLREGLRLAAAELASREETESIYATSWIVAKNPQLLEQLGFTLEGEIDETERRSLFSDEHRPVARASISREDFLALHLK